MKIKMLFLCFITAIGFKNSVLLGNAVDLIPGGQNVGIEIKPDGLIISGTYDVKINDSTYNPSKDSDIKRGDILFEVEKQKVSGIEDFSKVFNKYTGTKNEVEVSLKRKSNVIKRKLRLIKENNSYKTGLYIKERILGIGTVSFYDPERNIFGALGHAVVDNDSGNIVEVKEGSIYKSSITSINKSKDGDPGEKVASFDQNSQLGTILENTSIGIYGTYNHSKEGLKTIKMANADEVEVGPAKIYTVIKGNTVQSFDIKITSLVKQNICDIKGISFKVIDKTLLNLTGGIVAGMSGSPIIQNNMLVGAVTHVLVENVECGYGIYMQWMYEEALKLINS